MLLANRADSITVLVTGSSTAAVLQALCGSTAIITSPLKGFLLPSGSVLARRAMQLLAAQTSLEPQPHRVSRAGRGAVREPEHPKATAADSRASPPAQRPRIPDPQAPSDDLNKLPNLALLLSCVTRRPASRRLAGSCLFMVPGQACSGAIFRTARAARAGTGADHRN